MSLAVCNLLHQMCRSCKTKWLHCETSVSCFVGLMAVSFRWIQWRDRDDKNINRSAHERRNSNSVFYLRRKNSDCGEMLLQQAPILLECRGPFVTTTQYFKVKRENEQDATNSMFIIKLPSQHVSGIIMPIIRRIRPCPTACGVLPECVGCGLVELCRELCAHSTHGSRRSSTQPQPTHPGRTPHAVGHGLILLMMGIMMPETCWDGSLIINIQLVASYWFSLFALCSRCTVTRT